MTSFIRRLNPHNPLGRHTAGRYDVVSANGLSGINSIKTLFVPEH